MKQDLNGHYCLATEEQAKNLYKNFKVFGSHETGWPYFGVLTDGLVYQYESLDSVKQAYLKPMHLHNDSWVFGSLEHEKCKHESTRPYNVFGAVVCNDCGYVHQGKPKPVEPITEEDILYMLDTTDDIAIENAAMRISDYIKYLEANQKESK